MVVFVEAFEMGELRMREILEISRELVKSNF